MPLSRISDSLVISVISLRRLDISNLLSTKKKHPKRYSGFSCVDI